MISTDLTKAFSFLLAFSQMSETWPLNVKFETNLMPRNNSHLLFVFVETTNFDTNVFIDSDEYICQYCLLKDYFQVNQTVHYFKNIICVTSHMWEVIIDMTCNVYVSYSEKKFCKIILNRSGTIFEHCRTPNKISNQLPSFLFFIFFLIRIVVMN